MSNLLQYTDKSKTINNKLALMLSDITHAYESGEIKTETEYYYRIKNMINNFYSNINKTSFKYRPAETSPVSSDYNAMITEAYGDMQYIINDCKHLSSSLQQSFVDAELSRNIMTNELSRLGQKVSNIIESISLKQNNNGVVIFTELFSNSNAAGNKSDINSCSIDSENGILTLKHHTSNNINISKITIDEQESNGFPGNTHCVDVTNKELHFIGQDGLHNDLNHIIDNSLDTWFEFELFELPAHTKERCNNYGFEYAEGVSWVGEGPLKLKLILHINDNTPCSWLTLNPYLSDIKGVESCIIESCNVITTNNFVHKVADNMSFNESKSLMFPSSSVKRIELILSQPNWYNTKVGHYYYTEVNTKSMSIFQEYDVNDDYSRVEGKQPSVNMLNVKYDPLTQWVKYNDSDENSLEKHFVKNELFTLPPSTIQKKASQEMVDAYRYMIGIRDISLKSFIFSEESEFVSNTYTTKESITSVSLEVQEFIPGDNPEILTYYLTFDDGVNWHQIHPIHRAYNGIYKYTINTDTISNLMSNKETSIKKSKNLNMLIDVHSFKLKIHMTRPTGVAFPESSTPVVYQYKLIVETGGDSIEY